MRFTRSTPPPNPPKEKQEETIMFIDKVVQFERQPVCMGVGDCLLMPNTPNADLTYAALLLKAPERVVKGICRHTQSDVDVLRKWARERINDS